MSNRAYFYFEKRSEIRPDNLDIIKGKYYGFALVDDYEKDHYTFYSRDAFEEALSEENRNYLLQMIHLILKYDTGNMIDTLVALLENSDGLHVHRSYYNHVDVQNAYDLYKKELELKCQNSN